MTPEDQLKASAERELGAFLTVVSESFGAGQARRAADVWLDELEKREIPGAGGNFRAVTIAAAVRLAPWLNSGSGSRPAPRLNIPANELEELVPPERAGR
jgi:hypothetical protein